MIIVGIDAGGTKTKAIAYDCNGNYIGEGLAGSGNYHNVGLPKAIEHIREAAIKAAGREPDIISMGVAGLDSKYDWDNFLPLATSLAKKVFVYHDGAIALFAETLGNPGVVVIAGTGSVVEGFDGNQFYRVGGRGWLLSDTGSAYWIGRKALRKVLKMMDGVIPKSELYYEVLDKIKIKDLDDLVLWAYNSSCQIDLVASVAESVNRAAEKGDEIAISILKEGAEKLAKDAVFLTKKLKFKVVYLKGGMFNSKIYHMAFTNYLSLHGIKGDVGKNPPEMGAIFIAFKQLGCNISNILKAPHPHF
ncbi:MAG: BadF/BadG/BcrA/BcrD ATPase family protein [Sulfolobus sp.]|jgi:N-acetylglucosamine kinase-like BadF-type ATPase